MFTTRHYLAIGKTLQEIIKTNTVDADVMGIIVRKFADTFEKDNEKFDDIKFTKFVFLESNKE